MNPASTKPEGSYDRETDSIPRLIMLLFVGAFAAGAVIGYFTQGFGFFSRSAPIASTPSRSPAAVPSKPPQQTRAVQVPKPIATPAPVSPRPRARVTSPDYVAPSKPRVSSEVPEPAAAAPGSVFRVQAGAFRSRENAEILVQRLEKDGFRAHITLARGLHRVRVGAFTSREDATRLAQELKGKKYDAFVAP